MQESRGEVLRPEIRNVPIELVGALGRLANGSNLVVLGLGVQLPPNPDTLVLGTNLNNAVTMVAYLTNPNPDIPVTIFGTNGDQVATIKEAVSQSHHKVLEQSDKIDEITSSPLKNTGLFIRAAQKEGQDAIVKFVLSSDTFEPQSSRGSEIEDMLPMHDIKDYLENELGLNIKTSRRALNQIRKLDTKHVAYPNLAFSKSKILAAFDEGKFNDIPGFDKKDLSILLSIIKHITNQ